MSVTWGGGKRSFAAAAATQWRVIGALILREMQTRFGRHNVGFLWLFAEPLILALAIGGIKRASRFDDGSGLPPELMAIIGYVPFFLFRAVVNRSAGAIHSNLTLMFHRQVTILDTMTARTILEAGACLTVIVLILVVAGHVTGIWPSDPLLMIAGFGMLLLYCNGLALLVAAGCARYELLERFVHPFTYLMMPLSGAFFMVATLPADLQWWLLWNPQVHMHESIREGMFGDHILSIFDFEYMLWWVLGINFLGLLAIRAVRPRLDVF